MNPDTVSNISIAACGINCNTCPVFIATAKNDIEPLRDFAARGAKKWNAPESVFMEMRCWGCQQEEKPRSEHCSNCKTRNCAQSKDYENCAWCKEFEHCTILQEQNDSAIQPSRVNLIALRKQNGLS